MTKLHGDFEFGSFRERLKHFCALLDIDPPELVYENSEPTLTDPLMDWIRETSANMDWLFCGSPCALLRNWVTAQGEEREPVEPPDPLVAQADQFFEIYEAPPGTEEEGDARADAAFEVANAMLKIEPASIAGAVALLRVVESELREGVIWDGNTQMVASAGNFLQKVGEPNVE